MATYIQIGSTVTVGAGGAANIEWTSIPATYTDLLLKLSLRSDATGGYVAVGYAFNGATTNYGNTKTLDGNGTAAESYNDTTITIGGTVYGRLSSWGINTASQTASTFTSIDWYIPNYTAANNKGHNSDWAQESNATAVYIQMATGIWSNTAAISSIKLIPSAGNLVQYSTASLYGISKS